MVGGWINEEQHLLDKEESWERSRRRNLYLIRGKTKASMCDISKRQHHTLNNCSMLAVDGLKSVRQGKNYSKSGHCPRTGRKGLHGHPRLVKLDSKRSGIISEWFSQENCHEQSVVWQRSFWLLRGKMRAVNESVSQGRYGHIPGRCPGTSGRDSSEMAGTVQ